jgi:NAD(P)-dependent dehydrogenase (short-subunit alcohol dehydrogenase family)
VEEMTLDGFLDELRGTLASAFLCSQAVMSEHQATQTRSIVNIGSIYGILAVDHRIYSDLSRQTPIGYSCAKAGLVQMTKYLAAYWATRGVRVNCISAGGIAGKQSKEFLDRYNNRIPMARMATASEVAATVAFLASDASSYMTGTNLMVDGGLHIW